MDWKTDCLEFLGDRPCRPHKLRGRVCRDCPEYTPELGKILLVKLGALGDVVRTLPLLEALKKAYPKFRIWVITQKPASPFFLANPFVDRVFLLEHAPVILPHVTFTVAANLDLDPLACAVLRSARARRKLGFSLDSAGNIVPHDERAKEWYAMSLDDTKKKANRLTYQDHMARILGVPFSGEPIRIELGQKRIEAARELLERLGFNPKLRPLIGLNTGSSPRWPLKTPNQEHFLELIRLLDERGLTPVTLLGGKKEIEKNRYIANALPGKAIALDVFEDILDFAALVSQHSLIVTGDTLALHLALGFGVRVVALFGPTSAQEIEIYGIGRKLIGKVPCIGCYLSDCHQKPTCMDTITPKEVLSAILEQLGLSLYSPYVQ